MPSKEDLLQRQSLPLRAKVLMTQNRIREWYNYWGGDVYVSFSGGKDSTVLAHLVHELYPEVPLVFSNTGLEYPEIQAFARKTGAEFIRPKMRFDEVISAYGYPLISKEVAEAIHFARRIVPNNGGGVQGNTASTAGNARPTKDGYHSDLYRRRGDLDGSRTYGGGGTQQQTENSGNCSTFQDHQNLMGGYC